MKKYKVGLTIGTFDMFNVEHLNILRKAKVLCDYLIVGVSTDMFCESCSSKKPIINELDRMAIVESIRFVDRVILQKDKEISKSVQKLGADVLFVSSDSNRNDGWEMYEKDFLTADYNVVYLDHSDFDSAIMFRDDFIHYDRLRHKNQIVGYTTGVFDMFHIGHLNILKRAKESCNFLIVGVSTDENVEVYKHKTPMIPYIERALIISSVRYVDAVVPQVNMDKFSAWEKLHFDVLYHGDDWKGSGMYNEIENKLSKVGCKMVFLPHTDGISSSLLQKRLTQ